MLKFIREYIKAPMSVGAIAPSGRFLARRMVENIDFEKAGCIVEYGPGTGAFTKELVARKNHNTKLILIERNKRFYDDMVALYSAAPNVIIINGSAENVDSYLSASRVENVDYIVSDLPFTSMPKETSAGIMAKTQAIIGQKGEFITFQYTLLKKEFFKKYFDLKSTTYIFLNMPPAFVLTFHNYSPWVKAKENSNG